MSRHPSYPFVRCMLAWEDAWGNPPQPTDRWHWCALPPGGHETHACTCGAEHSGSAVPSSAIGSRAARRLRTAALA